MGLRQQFRIAVRRTLQQTHHYKHTTAQHYAAAKRRKPDGGYKVLLWLHLATTFQCTRQLKYTDRAVLTGKHGTLVRRAPGWQRAHDDRQAKN